MTTITIRLSEEEKDNIIKFAVDNDLSMSQVVRRALKEYFTSLEPKEKEN